MNHPLDPSTTPAPPARPFAESVADYALAGWPCVLPVPLIEKSPPPAGFTGADGRDTDPLQLATWLESHGDWSVALRMPDGVIGIDVDAYEKAGKVKHGDATLTAAVERWGELPATWSSTARGEGPSRISFFRVPSGRYATKLDAPGGRGGDVEIIQRHHRYAVVAPSPHANGHTYRWYAPDGAVTDAPPKPGELAELPAAWVQGLAEGAAAASPAAAGVDAGHAMLTALLADTRPACAEMAAARLATQHDLQEPGALDAGSRHDTMTGRVHHLVQLAAAGHTGVPVAIDTLAQFWAALTLGEDRAEEFDRMLLTSARKAVTAVGPRPVTNDPCQLVGDVPIATPGGPAPVDDRPGSDAPEPIEAPRELHPAEIVGGTPFTPLAHLDQTLADAVLQRMFPVLRFGYDVGGFLLRERTVWDQRADLAEWAVAQVAEMAPRGDPDAEKGSQAKDEADRRKRLMTAAGAGAIAKKMRARVAGGAHPCALRVGDLDTEPWLLWAGGIGWDLTLSHEQPVQAQIDPATPHLRSAGVVPDARDTPLWDAFTTAVWPDPELRAWALRVLAIAVTGYADRALPILLGERGRGKTQVIALAMSVLGNYAHAADPRLLNGLDNAHASIIYALKGRRLSFIDEGPREGRLGQERLKQLTGGGDLTGNQMNRNPITFTPTHTLVLTANDDPVLTDPAIRDRVRLIPCEGDPDAVRAARRAIGHTSSSTWRREAPGVLAKFMAEAAAWLTDPDTALSSAAPAAYRQRVEQLVLEQDPIRTWLDDETEPHPDGDRSRALYEAFVGWCKNGNHAPGRIASETKWGRELTKLGFPVIRQRDANHRPLRLRPRSPFPIGGGFTPTSGRLVDGSSSTLHTPGSPVNAGPETTANDLGGGLEGFAQTPAHVGAHARATQAQAGARAWPQPEQPSNPPQPSPADPRPFSRQISDKIIHGDPLDTASPVDHLTRTERSAANRERSDDRERDEARQRANTKAGRAEEREANRARHAETKAAEKAAKRATAIADAGGPLVTLPALVTRDGAVREIALEQVPAIAATFDFANELTVDVEHTGFWVGHADYALRTVQLGGEHAALVLDADDPAQRDTVRSLLEHAAVLHAHSASADLVPLAVAGLLEHDEAWTRMADTVIAAKLADPASTGSDPDLKNLAGTVLGDAAVAPGADEARKQLFAAGKWLTDTKATTPVQRSGWAQSDRRSSVMVRYAASDVLDAAALARALPQPPPAILERERTAQRLTARVAHDGVRLDADHIEAKLPEHQAGLADAGARLQAHGIDNPGSDQQVAARLVQLGAPLPTTKTGRPSVAKGAIEQFRKLDGPVGDLVRARLDYQHHETVIGLFLQPYSELVHRGDGRARPTVYTLGADTGRMSSVRPNLQQVPRQGGIRQCITADPGEVIISADFSSVEVRVAAALTGDPNLAQMMREGVDLHWLVARQAYGPDATKEDRYVTKRGVFQKFYGGSITGIAKTLAITEQEAAAISASLDAMTPVMARWVDGLKQAVRGGLDHFDTYSGRRIHIDPRFPHKAFNYCVQGTARELLVDALVAWQDTPWGRCRLIPVHDEVLAFVPEADAEAATAALVACMRSDLYGIDIKVEPSEPSYAWKDAS